MLADARLIAFLASTDLARSAAFFVDTLGLTERETTPYALVLDGLGTELLVTLVEDKVVTPYTVLGWTVDDLDAHIDHLQERGVTFHRYDGLTQDVRGVWKAPSGARIAWFSDPDANTLSLHQPA